MSDRATFEAAIRDNPTDATTHHAYADYLAEIGDHEESEFRRSMAEWMDLHSTRNNRTHRAVEGYIRPHSYTSFRFGAGGSGIMPGTTVPAGVNADLFPHWHGFSYAGDRNLFPPGDSLTPTRHGDEGLIWWGSYPDMEAAFRRAFKSERKPNPEQFAKKLSDALKPTE